MQVQNFALARQEIVLNVEAIHRFEMALKNRDRNQIRDRRGLIVSFLDRVQRLRARLLVRLVFFVPLRNARIEIPAHIIKPRRGR